ncbi:signal recognition particle-docking protein FtsY [Enterococcus sp. 7F3_DIV0205]|uniref:Signal recognition particle receptor FtsY n=1 Tax=Candidatus Enterococcus palustris TaxID=1834189 RepID=A0AAQ3Y6V8_9ENTE|nr:signal recognition particle-docking protein FtsY [Enterococcus sp. 7F3_DIV0205]OTN83035.1 signal recognition particle-docking protein FtsY [Enterococcus sp. 7F3_DIV0205]
MGFFDKIKKAFMNEKETPPAEIKTDEEVIEPVQEEVMPEEKQADTESLEQVQEETFEAAEEPEKEREPEIDPLITVNPVTQAEELVDPEIIEEQEEEIIVQEKYEKGLEKTRKTFGERLNELFANFRSVDEDFFEELEETLIGADVGFDTAIKITESLRQEVKLRNVKKPAAVQNTIIEKMVDLYEAEGIEENNALNIQEKGLTVMLFVGVNGVGKTTSIGKLAHEFKQDGKKVLMAAADTFRAGAIDQLVVWGERAGVEVVRGNAGGDPAAVVFDAVDRAKAENADILLVDTAGRLQNKVNLMNELEKIKRVIQRELPDAPHEVLLVVDATTGQNAMSQAKQFKETTDVTGLVLTKLDGTAKGGIVLAIRNELHLPVKLVGLGEGIDDLEPFDANDFAIGLFKGLLKEED